MYLARQLTLLGSASPYTQPMWVFLLLGALVFFGVSVGSLIVTLRRGVKNHSQAPTPSRTAWTTPLLQSKAGRIGKTLVILLFAASGWIWHYAHYLKEYEIWKQQGAENQKSYQENTSAWQKDVAAWKARQKENR